MKILVIEDQPIELKLAGHVLEAAGFSVNGLDAAEEAFASIKQDRPQLILLDMALPGMDGLALVRKLKTEPETRDIPIVALTSHPERFPRMAALNAGCDAYFVKPINTRTLPQELSVLAARGGRNSP